MAVQGAESVAVAALVMAAEVLAKTGMVGAWLAREAEQEAVQVGTRAGSQAGTQAAQAAAMARMQRRSMTRPPIQIPSTRSSPSGRLASQAR